MIKKSDKKVSKKIQNRQMYWIVWIMATLLVGILVFWYLTQTMHSFNYRGLSFTKERASEDLFVYHYYNYFKDPQGQLYKANTYLRNDPRRNDVPIDVTTEFPFGKYVFVSINQTGLSNCTDSSLAIATITQFFTNNLLTVKGATVDKDEATNQSLRYVTCETDPNNPVIIFKSSDKTEVIETKQNCYEIRIANCEILKAVEKFELQTLIDAKARLS
jgi:hypothetical protein